MGSLQGPRVLGQVKVRDLLTGVRRYSGGRRKKAVGGEGSNYRETVQGGNESPDRREKRMTDKLRGLGEADQASVIVPNPNVKVKKGRGG